MSVSARSIQFDDNSMWVVLSDGRTLGVPLAWFPRLLHATPEQREQCERSANGLHWDALNEDISIAGLLAGRGDGTSPTKVAACIDKRSVTLPVDFGNYRQDIAPSNH